MLHQHIINTLKEKDMNKEQVGMMYIERCDVELARKVLDQHIRSNSQEALCPEEYGDGQDDKEHFPVQGDDREKKLNGVVDLQERMAKGMFMIQHANKVIEGFFKDNKYMPAIYNAWSGKMDEYKAKAFLTRDCNQVYFSWFDHRARLWDCWNGIKAQCTTLIGIDTYTWVQYFELEQESSNLYYVTSDSEELDNLVALFRGQEETIDSMFETHMVEEREYNKKVQVKWPERTGGYVPFCKDVTHLYVETEEVPLDVYMEELVEQEMALVHLYQEV